MQNSSLPGAFEILKKKRLRRENLAEKLRRLKQTLAKKTKAPKLKSLREKQTKKNQLGSHLLGRIEKKDGSSQTKHKED